MDVRYGEARMRAVTQANNTTLEPISPELVLVDPELRREVRARMLQDLCLEALDPSPALVEPAPEPLVPVEPEHPPSPPSAPPPTAIHRREDVVPEPRKRRRLAPALLPVSIALNVILIALSVSDARVAQTSPSSPLAIDRPATSRLEPIAPTTTAQRPPVAAPKTKRRAAPRQSTVAGVTRGEAEQRVLTTVIQSPGGKLPKALIDPTTGLAKNGLQAHCRAVTRSRSFLCVVRPAQHRAGEGLYVRYHPKVKGTGNFTWYPYRSK
jgi:hypothetical protein